MALAAIDTIDTAETIDELVALGWELNANHYRVVHLAARYDDELTWFRQGLPSPAVGIAHRLGIHTSTAREWIRVGHCLHYFPLIDEAFRANEISYAQARILTRWVNGDNEQELLNLAARHTANRLTTAIAQALAVDEDDDERDRRHHDGRALTSYTDGDGMVIIRVVLPPQVAKPILATIETLVHDIAHTPPNGPAYAPDHHTVTTHASADAPDETIVTTEPGPTTPGDAGASADASDQRNVTTQPEPATHSDAHASADGSDRQSVTKPSPATRTTTYATADESNEPSVTTEPSPATAGDGLASADASGERSVASWPSPATPGDPGASADASDPPQPRPLADTLGEFQRRWHPEPDEFSALPTLAQQRADAFCLLLLHDIGVTTEVIIHIRGDANTFDDGTPLTTNAITRQLPESFIRLMLHDAQRRPVNASNRRRHPTTRQRRVTLEAHRHQCVDCGATDLLELDHNPPWHRTRRTITTELEPRCAPCHRARHRTAA